MMTWQTSAPELAAERDGTTAACHSWCPDDGDDVVHGGRGIDVLNLPSLTAASLIGTLRLSGEDGARRGLALLIGADGAVTFPDEAGRAQVVSGTLAIDGRRLRFFGIRRIEFGPER
ncbi:hypothetical protein G3576_26850 [Roseomonas stagni]|uniref:Uncharacterized protein n=1 Tax=Falsiroseomonas algicola TaxID=2716930 RepID=A0A6M1LTA7_9PROT|nr:hypothetical protein [Falsiroseomonas algicola]NGM23661.1 hypothetical protein [Falsiroseomonas algicola]